MDFNPDHYLAQTSGFDPDAYLAETQAPAPQAGKLESAVRGGAQGATVGFADELTGGLEALKDKLKGTDGNFGDLYRQHRDESRANYSAAEAANPWTYRGGEMAGGLASLAAAPEAMGVKGMAALGAASGLGNSKADLTEGNVVGAAEDTALGGAMGAAGYGAGRLLSKIPGAVSYGTKKAVSSIFGPSMEAIDARLANPAAIRKASEAGLEGIAEKIPKAVGSMKEQVGNLSDEAWDKLSPEIFNSPGVMTKRQLLGKISSLQNEMRTGGEVVGSSDEAAFRRLDALKSKIQNLYSNKTGLAKEFSDRIPETDLKATLQSLDSDINWQAPENKPTNVALERLRSFIDDNLKTSNKPYAKAMEPVSQRQDVISYLSRKMNLKNTSEGLAPTDATLSSVKNVLNENKGVTQDYLGKLKEFTGEDIPSAVQNYKYAQEFDRPYTNGSRNAVAGAAIGGAIGHFLPVPGGAWVGSAAGAMAGRQIDKEGAAMAGHMIDWWVENRPDALGQYAPVLQKALQKGTQALTAAHYVLQQQDPNYNVMLRAMGQ